jgi:hypothetical protein
VYPNPLVADLIVSGIANRMSLLVQHRIEPDANMLEALARLDAELDRVAAAVRVSIEFLEGRGRAPRTVAHVDHLS